MNTIWTIILLTMFFGCGQANKNTVITMDNSVELYNTFNKKNHLQPDFKKISFDTLHSWDFGWAILEPLNLGAGDEKEIALSKRLSPGQKTLYFFWYLDAQVTNGGFIQFYWNNKRKYLPPIIDGLKLIGDTQLLKLVEKADRQYLLDKDKFDFQRTKEDWEPLYDNLKEFDEFDELYYKIHNKTMDLIEQYARQHPDEFVKLK